MTPNRTRQPEAFTLLEMVAALAIVGVIALSLFSALRTAINAEESGTAVIERARRIATTAELIRLDLHGAMPPTGILASAFIGRDGDSGDADHDTLLFATDTGVADITYTGLDYALRGTAGLAALNADQPITTDVREVEITLVAEGDNDNSRDDESNPGLNLVRRVRRNLLAETEPEFEETVLLRGVESARLRYFDGSQWLDSWDSGAQDNALPTAVELTLGLAREARPLRLVFTVPAAATAAAQEGAVIR